jgi:hypothetical protein
VFRFDVVRRRSTLRSIKIDCAFKRIRYDPTQQSIQRDVSHRRGEETSFEAANSSPIVEAADEATLRAVAATVQYKMDHGSALFPVMVEGLMQKTSAVNNIVSV